jgi:DNA-3-methyladenine glycosylase
MSKFLVRSFFERPFLEVARDLVGCTLVWDGCAGVIVELEAYAVEGDAACHTMSRPSAREFVARHPAGSAYVYLNYGMYWLLNVLVKGGGEDGIILLRALEPRAGLELMCARRGRERSEDLCSGPGKLGRAVNLGRHDHGRELAGRSQRARLHGFQPRDPGFEPDIVADSRIGISRAIELPWRFSLRGNLHVSVRPRPLATGGNGGSLKTGAAV